MIRLEGITKSFGGLQVLRGIDLEIEKGKKKRKRKSMRGGRSIQRDARPFGRLFHP